MTDAQRSCYGKTRYPSEEAATSVSTSCYYERGARLRVYACTECGGYHLTKTDVAPVKPGFRPPRLSQRAEAQEGRRWQRPRRRRG